MADLFPSNDEQFSVGLGNFISVANANLVALGLVAADITKLTGDKTDIDAKIAASKTAAEALKSATGAKRASRTTGNTDLRAVIRKVEATPDVPTSLLLALGLNVRDGKPTPVQPTTPTDLVAYGADTGVNALKWNKNGNKSGTTYIIEARLAGIGAFMFVDTTTKSSFNHQDQTPGQRVEYRVKAKRPAGESQYSNVAIAYGLVMQQAA